MLKNVIEITRSSRENFMADPSIAGALTWGYNVGRLTGIYKNAVRNPESNIDELEGAEDEISMYIGYKG